MTASDSTRIRIEDSLEAINDHFFEQGWTDGLPIVPPTSDRVERMLAWCDHDPEQELGAMPPRQGIVTIEKLAVNAVMAGCRPEYLPVVIAATEAMLEERFNLYAVQSTTHPCAPLLILNGPIGRELGVNSRYNAFGPGWRANATIGRAIRLILLNVGGGAPGVLDRATQGQPAKYSYCIASKTRRVRAMSHESLRRRAVLFRSRSETPAPSKAMPTHRSERTGRGKPMADFVVIPERTALSNVDMQDCFVEGSPMWAPDGRAVLDDINRVAAACRRAGVLVIHRSNVLRPDGSNVGVLDEISPGG